MVAGNNASGKLPRVNLQGVAIGNGFVAPLEMVGGYADIIFNACVLRARRPLPPSSARSKGRPP